MTIYNLDKIFHPASIAVIGASATPGSIGNILIDNLARGGFKGALYPINPKYESIRSFRAYPSILQAPEHVDLAVIATPIATIPAIVADCAKARVGGAVILSAGGREVGDRGKEIEARISAVCQKEGLRAIGPNCVGIICAGSRLNATFASQMALPGNMAFVSQSGALCSGILDLSLQERIGFSHFVSVGSMVDVDFGDLIDYLGNEPEVKSIVLYIEGLTHFRKFMSAARAVSRVKPIVALKAGRSQAGAQAAVSHTGSLAGEDAVYDAAFKRAGILRVRTIEELFDCAELMAKQTLPQGSNLAIVTNAGGPGVMAADALAVHGLQPATLSESLVKKLDQFLPAYWSHGNPIDILGDATPERYQQVVNACLEAPEINGLIVIFSPQAVCDPVSVAEALADMLLKIPYPVFTVWLGGWGAQKGREIFNNAGIPTYETPERAIDAFVSMYDYTRNVELLQETPRRRPQIVFDQPGARGLIEAALNQGNTLLTEVESKELLKAYGIPVNRTEVAVSGEHAVRLADDMGYPVAMKIHSRDITHKSDADCVQLNLRNASDVESAYDRILENARNYNPDAALLGVTIQPMIVQRDYELIIGGKTDADFGPVIVFGMGGFMTEALQDRAIGLPPLNRLLAHRLMEDTRIYRLLKGFRGRPPANMELLEEILICLSQLVTDFPQIAELDMNPVIVQGDSALAVDARVVVRKNAVPAPLHMAISPYPDRYEKTCLTKSGLEIFLRPIRPEDEPLLSDFYFHSLSAESRYYRFFSAIKELPHKTLARLTQIDYDRDATLVALDKQAETETMVGVCRMERIPGTDKAEAAITVADRWQGKGIGAKMLESCVSIARERGIQLLFGYVLAGNTNMLALARKLGFVIKPGPEGYDYEVEADLSAGKTF